MTQLTKNELLAKLSNANVDFNDPEALMAFSNAIKSHAISISTLGLPEAEQHFGIRNVVDAITAGVSPKSTISGIFNSYTMSEFMTKTKSSHLTKVFVTKGAEIGLQFTEGCIYCGSAQCGAFTRGESVCG